MRKREKGQLLPTPQTSTTSSNVSWGEREDDFFYSSEIDEIVVDNRKEKIKYGLRTGTSKTKTLPLAFPTKRPRLLRTCTNNIGPSIASATKRSSDRTIQERKKSSWPFRSHYRSGDLISSFYSLSDDDFYRERNDTNLSEEFKSELLSFRRLLQKRFPYDRVLNGLKPAIREVLLDKSTWNFLLTVSSFYAGEDARGDLQKRAEIAFAALTTLMRFYLVRRCRGGRERLLKLGVAAVVLQAKLLEEADVDLTKLEKQVNKFFVVLSIDKTAIEKGEREISEILNWKLLTPSPQVFLFKAMDVLGRRMASLSNNLKLLVSKVLDYLIEKMFVQKCFNNRVTCVPAIVLNILGLVLEDFFSAFRKPAAHKDIPDLIEQMFSTFVKIEEFPEFLKADVMAAIEAVVMNCH